MLVATQEMSDEALMKAVQQGTLEDAEGLFDRYHRPIGSFFYRMGLSYEDSQDLTQTVFYRVLRYRDSYQPDKPFKTWLYQIARNVLKTHLGTLKGFQDDFTPLENIGEQAGRAIDAMDLKAQYEALYEALDRLPADKRELLVLSKFQGFKYEELSQLTGMTVANIKVTVHRGLEMLRKVYFSMH